MVSHVIEFIKCSEVTRVIQYHLLRVSPACPLDVAAAWFAARRLDGSTGCGRDVTSAPRWSVTPERVRGEVVRVLSPRGCPLENTLGDCVCVRCDTQWCSAIKEDRRGRDPRRITAGKH